MKMRDRLIVVTSSLRQRRKLLLAAGIALGLAIAVLAYTVSSGTGPTGPGAAGGAVVNGVTQDASGKTVAYWFDPMVPGERFNAPGKSSMGMDLQPKYAEEGGGGIRVSPEVQQNLGVRTTRATFASLAPTLTAVGRVETDERRIVEVQTLTPGFVEQLAVRAVGETVGRGQRVASVYSPELYGAQQEYATLRKLRSSAITPGLAGAARKRLQLLGLPEGVIRNVERTGRPQRSYPVFAPRSGVVTAIGARPGARVELGQSILTVADLSTVWVVAEVPEASLGQVRRGQMVDISFPAYPGEVRQGRIDYIFPTLDPEARTGRVRLTLTNPGGRLRIGMFANLKISGTAVGGLVIPTEAVISTGARNVVIVRCNGAFIPVEVALGRTAGGMTEIRRGLALNDEVVVSGQFLIDSEASLAGVIERLSRGQQPAAQQQSQQDRVRARGVVKTVDGAGGRITLSHEAVPAMNWPAMTMTFSVRDRSLLRGRKAGEHVMFGFQRPQSGQTAVIDRIAPDGGQ